MLGTMSHCWRLSSDRPEPDTFRRKESRVNGVSHSDFKEMSDKSRDTLGVVEEETEVVPTKR